MKIVCPGAGKGGIRISEMLRSGVAMERLETTDLERGWRRQVNPFLVPCDRGLVQGLCPQTTNQVSQMEWRDLKD